MANEWIRAPGKLDNSVFAFEGEKRFWIGRLSS